MSQKVTSTSEKPKEAASKTRKTAGRRPKPLPRQADGLLVLPEVPSRIYSGMTATNRLTARLCNALVEESRELRQRIINLDAAHGERITTIRDEYLHMVSDVRDKFLK